MARGKRPLLGVIRHSLFLSTVLRNRIFFIRYNVFMSHEYDDGLVSIPMEVLYQMRILVFFEESPQSNRYRQVIFNEEDFKKMSDSIGDKKPIGAGFEEFKVELSTKSYLLPDLQEIYPNKK